MSRIADRRGRVGALLVATAVAAFSVYVGVGAQGADAPRYKFDPEWPKPLPNKWKLGGIIGIGMQDDNSLWVYNRPGDLTALAIRLRGDRSGERVGVPFGETVRCSRSDCDWWIEVKPGSKLWLALYPPTDAEKSES